MTPMLLGLFVKKLQPKVGLGRYDILFAYFVVEGKAIANSHYTGSCSKRNFPNIILRFCPEKNVKRIILI